MSALPDSDRASDPVRTVTAEDIRAEPVLRHALAPIAVGAAWICLVQTLPRWAMASPLTLLSGGLGSLAGGGVAQVVTSVLLAVVVVLFLRTVLRGKSGGLAGAALVEERVFRAGAETWSRKRRATSNAAFGVLHALNLFYPFAVLPVLALQGALFMRIYLHTFAATGSREAALTRSAAVHYAYNRAVFFVGVPFILAIQAYRGIS